ncbi:MAG: lysophospholipid acyltransferase family protein [Fusobacteriaceae bacterium]|jgi:lysophospholipid acyltransferase (LPLAT)-like uncharacterized protein|nr:lysophospholipid acyltransferase family protein [Fusobacteriaceae bacterium]
MNEKKKYRVIGSVLYCILKLLSRTLRIKIINESGVDLPASNYIVGFWHDKLLIPTLITPGFFQKRAVLVSPSKDGELISVPLEKSGFEIIRGSSGENSVSGLLSLMRCLKRGFSIGTPLDGPKGPRLKAKAGLLYLSQKTGVPLLPVGGQYRRKLILKKTWDRFQIPLPFTTIVCILGKPWSPPDDGELERCAESVEQILNDLNDRAAAYL